MKRILIVDDESEIRDAVRLCLQNGDYEIHEAANGEEGLNKAREVRPDLVILDLMMPDKWGYVVCEELKKEPETRRAAVLFLTGRKSPPSKKMGQMKGADDYIVKPFEPAELRRKVRKLIGEK